MSQYTVTVETTIDPFPMIPAFIPETAEFTQAEGSAADFDPFPMIPWQTQFAEEPAAEVKPARFTANRKALLQRVANVARFTPRKSFRPILQNVRVSVNGTVELAATDVECGILTDDDFTRQGERVALVPVNRLTAALKQLKSSEVTCELTDGRFSISADGATLTIPATDKPEEFPNVATAEGAATIVVDAAALALALDQTLFATDTVSTRYALGGVAFNVKPDGFTLAATDTRRLVVYDLPAVSVEGESGQCAVVPTKFLTALGAFLKSESTVRLQFTDASVSVIGTDWRAYSRLVEGRFPRYQDVIPVEFNREIVFKRDELISSIEMASVATSPESVGIDWKLPAVSGEGTVSLTGKSAECGESVATVRAAQVIQEPERIQTDKDDKPIETDAVTFDPRYILDYLRTLPKTCRYVQLAMFNSAGAAVWTAENMPSKYVAMPLSRDR